MNSKFCSPAPPISIQWEPQEAAYSILEGQLQQHVIAPDVAIDSEFPEVNPIWFYDGFPSSLVSTGPLQNGHPIDFVPVPYYVTKGPITITIDSISPLDAEMTLGLLDRDMNPITLPYTLPNATTGSIAFYKLYDADYFKTQFPQTQLIKRDTWYLLSDFGIVKTLTDTSQTLPIRYGFNIADIQNFSIEIGANTSPPPNRMFTDLSYKVSKAFYTDIFFCPQLSITTTINFPRTPLPQRTGFYQFVSEYNIVPGPTFQQLTDSSIIAGELLVPVLGRRAPFFYASNRFQKIFVVQPQESDLWEDYS